MAGWLCDRTTGLLESKALVESSGRGVVRHDVQGDHRRLSGESHLEKVLRENAPDPRSATLRLGDEAC
jgi:hypothetical protein